MDHYLRPAKLSDIDLLFKWANETETRINSFHPQMISYETHCEWFENKFNSTNTLIYIYYNNHIPIGQVRIDIEDNNNGIVDYSIDKEFRGAGHGKIMLSMMEDLIRENYPQIKSLTAFVKTSNNASKKIIEKLNYTNMYTVYSKTLR